MLMITRYLKKPTVEYGGISFLAYLIPIQLCWKIQLGEIIKQSNAFANLKYHDFGCFYWR